MKLAGRLEELGESNKKPKSAGTALVIDPPRTSSPESITFLENELERYKKAPLVAVVSDWVRPLTRHATMTLKHVHDGAMKMSWANFSTFLPQERGFLGPVVFKGDVTKSRATSLGRRRHDKAELRVWRDTNLGPRSGLQHSVQ